MSSHHIIREKQEPALLVLGLNNFADELLGQLLEWSPTLIVTAHTAESINAFGIKYDVLIDDGVTNDVLQADIKHIPLCDDGPARAALKYLISNNYPAVNIVADEFNLADYLVYATSINIVIFYNGQKNYPVTSGFSKWKPANDVITIFGDVTHIQFTGLTAIGNNRYQTTYDGFISLKFSAPFIFIAEDMA